MNWQAWFARDSGLWQFAFYVGAVVMVATGIIGLDPGGAAAYGIDPLVFKWLQLISAVIAALGGKMGLSFTASASQVAKGLPLISGTGDGK